VLLLLIELAFSWNEVKTRKRPNLFENAPFFSLKIKTPPFFKMGFSEIFQGQPLEWGPM
jgi:hypothetical protein